MDSTIVHPLENIVEPDRRIGAGLAILLLAVQVALPWTVPHFVTQDGPSHVYSALAARDLLIDRHSVQRNLYHFRFGIVPNWTSSVLLAIIATIVGASDAERVVVDLIVVVGFFSFRYALRAVAGAPVPATPLGNFLFNTWFLWLGFYNFALGMALFPFAAGFFLRHRQAFTPKRAVVLGCVTVLLFFHASHPGGNNRIDYPDNFAMDS